MTWCRYTPDRRFLAQDAEARSHPACSVARRAAAWFTRQGSRNSPSRLRISKHSGDFAGALASWRDATELLPQDTRQYTIIAGHIARLGRLAETQPSQTGQAAATQAGQARPAPPSRWSGGVISGLIGTLVLAVWKFKFIAVALLTKGKLLLLGLTKASTFFTMFASMGLYWTVFGGWLAVGLVLSIYVHEMGHVFALMRYGVKASAPLFIPGLGAVVLLKQALVDPKQDAGWSGRPNLGNGNRARMRGRLQTDVRPDLGGDRPVGRDHQPLQSPAVLAARRCPRLSQPEPTAALAGSRLDRHSLGGHRPGPAGLAPRRRSLAHDIGQARPRLRRPDRRAIRDPGDDPLGPVTTGGTDGSVGWPSSLTLPKRSPTSGVARLIRNVVLCAREQSGNNITVCPSGRHWVWPRMGPRFIARGSLPLESRSPSKPPRPVSRP